MIAKTADEQAVDLSQSENVRRGMVFNTEAGPVRATEPYQRTCAPTGLWRAEYLRGEGVYCAVDPAKRAFLGCDPTIATRGDCVTFGIAPGIDAGAHGFARTRDGFAVDLRREAIAGAVVMNGEKRYTYKNLARLYDFERFIGLDMRHAKPEDVKRLCCGAQHVSWSPFVADEMGMDPTRAPRCTLAIGEHDQCEDIVTGTRWAASAKSSEVDAWHARADVAGTAESIQRKAMRVRAAPMSPVKSNRLTFNGVNGGTLYDEAHVDVSGEFWCACGTESSGSHRDGCKLQWQYREAVSAAWMVVQKGGDIDAAGRAAIEVVTAAAAVTLLAWMLPHTASGRLAARDAAVAKAIADVPAGCDANGWAHVIKVIAADSWEAHRTGEHIPALAAEAAVVTIRYAAERRAGWPRHVSEERAVAHLLDRGEDGYGRRHCAAYEVGR